MSFFVEFAEVHRVDTERDLDQQKDMVDDAVADSGVSDDYVQSETDDPLCHHHTAVNHQVESTLLCDVSHTVLDLEHVCRIAIMVTPEVSEDIIEEGWEAISTIRTILQQRPYPMTVTSQTVFLRCIEDQAPILDLFRAYFRNKMPVTNFVIQPPAGGQALAIEAWAVGGEGVDVQFPEPKMVTIDYQGLHWVHISGITPDDPNADAYSQSRQAFHKLERTLEHAGTTFKDVVRKWIYQGSITELEGDVERYRELNRARTDFFDELQAKDKLAICREGKMYYPASTGIGTLGHGVTLSCMSLQTERDDVQLLPLENPQQTSAFDYARSFSAKSPKFSRAMAIVIGEYITTWVSGTASIVDSETVHLGDIEKQTEQTIDNIEKLISAENFVNHGVEGGGAELTDLAKIRVYIKHAEDYEKCRVICERRFGVMPTIYAQADVCRSNLLVEIEGVAFSRIQ